MVRLEKVNYDNVWKILELKVAEGQENFVATNTQSIVEAYIALANGGYALPFGIFDDDLLVGFIMLSYDVDDEWEDAPEIAKKNYGIWRLMIDEKYQGKGYGRRALELILDFIRNEHPYGEAEYCYLSYEPENVVAKKLYNSLGFVETGDFDDGEAIAALKL